METNELPSTFLWIWIICACLFVAIAYNLTKFASKKLNLPSTKSFVLIAIVGGVTFSALYLIICSFFEPIFPVNTGNAINTMPLIYAVMAIIIASILGERKIEVIVSN